MLDSVGLQLDGLFYAATLLFFIFDPFASVPLFIAMTKGLDDKAMVSSANRAVLVAAILFFIFVLIGQPLLSMFGITIEGFKIAGGLVLLLMAMEIVFGLNMIRSGDQNVAWVIIATPILSGPGVISTAIILTVQLDPVTVLLAGSFSLLITWVLMRNAPPLRRGGGYERYRRVLQGGGPVDRGHRHRVHAGRHHGMAQCPRYRYEPRPAVRKAYKPFCYMARQWSSAASARATPSPTSVTTAIICALRIFKSSWSAG